MLFCQSRSHSYGGRGTTARGDAIAQHIAHRAMVSRVKAQRIAAHGKVGMHAGKMGGMGGQSGGMGLYSAYNMGSGNGGHGGGHGGHTGMNHNTGMPIAMKALMAGAGGGAYADSTHGFGNSNDIHLNNSSLLSSASLPAPNPLLLPGSTNVKSNEPSIFEKFKKISNPQDVASNAVAAVGGTPANSNFGNKTPAHSNYTSHAGASAGVSSAGASSAAANQRVNTSTGQKYSGGSSPFEKQLWSRLDLLRIIFLSVFIVLYMTRKCVLYHDILLAMLVFLIFCRTVYFLLFFPRLGEGRYVLVYNAVFSEAG